MKTSLLPKHMRLLIIAAAITTTLSAQSPIGFSGMLLKKSDIDILLSGASHLTKIIIVQSNIGAADPNRRTIQLSMLAFNDKNALIAPYNPGGLISSTTDSLYVNDIFYGGYILPKDKLTSLIPKNPYSYILFKPFLNRTDAILKDRFVSYTAYPVGPDGKTGIRKEGITSVVPTYLLNPSPPR